MTNQDFYQKLRVRIHSWLEKKGKGYKYADYLLFAPDLFHLMCKLSLDTRIPPADKAKLVGAIVYFVSPIDLMSEAVLGPVGFIDDIALAAFVLNKLINAGHGAVAEEHWAGDGTLLSVIRQIIEVADNMLGSGMWSRVKNVASSMGQRKNA